MKKLLFALMFLGLCSTAQAEDYYIIMDTDGTILRTCPVATCTPNENEVKLFKIVIVDFKDEAEMYDFINATEMLDGSGHYKVNVTNIEGKKERINVKVLKDKINNSSSSNNAN